MPAFYYLVLNMLTRTLFIFAFVSFCSTTLWCQNVFKVKVGGCDLSQFCVDCGDPKASYDETDFRKIISDLNSDYNFKGMRGNVAFQVLVDSLGQPCVLSHSDESKARFTLDIVQYLNQCRWTPATDHGKPVRASVNVIFSFEDGQLTGSIHRVDPANLIANMRNADPPVVYNNNYHYKNSSLRTYEISVWLKENSGLPQDMSQHSAVDKDGVFWCATLNGIATFDGHEFTRLSESNSPFKATQSAQSIAVDQDNNKWIATLDGLYKYDNKQWTKFTPEQIRTDGGIIHITCAPSGEVLVCTSNGLCILKNGQWELLSDQTIRQLPSNQVFYAYRDRRQRLWIGTLGGTIMIDTNKQVVEFNQSETPLKSTFIAGAVEDDAGNLYFSLTDYETRRERHKPKEGLAILSGDGNWQHLNDENSGLPSDHVNSLLFDPFEHVLWIGTNESGLVRWDLKKGWEVYHDQNSKVPNSHVFDLSQDSNGNVFASTYNGMIRIRRR
jgi:Two component regulator propeller